MYGTYTLTKTYGDAPFTNPLTKYGDGVVTYTSSDTNVATVNATTGEVTITGAGTTTITATVADGTYYTYEPNTAEYDLQVNMAEASISFETVSITKVYGDESFINPLTNTADGVITYSSACDNV